MQVIAETGEGYLVSATQEEISSILASVSKPINDKNPIGIGDKIPAYDYAAMIQKCKAFKDSYDFKKYKESVTALSNSGTKIINAIETLTFE